MDHPLQTCFTKIWPKIGEDALPPCLARPCGSVSAKVRRAVREARMWVWWGERVFVFVQSARNIIQLCCTPRRCGNARRRCSGTFRRP